MWGQQQEDEGMPLCEIPGKAISWKKLKREGRQSLVQGDVKLSVWRVEK